MTNPTPHGQVPDTLIDLIDAYAETRHRYCGIYNARTEAARKAAIEALSGVQALSAAPGVPSADSLRHQNKLLAETLGACILASGIVRKDIDGFTGTELLHFGEDLLSMLEAAPQQEAQEPVAYAIFAENGDIRLWATEPQHVKRIAAEQGLSLVKLYAAPQPAPAPLSDAQIAEMMRDTWGCASIAPRHAMGFARAVERAHGITQKGGAAALDCHHRPPCDECAALAAQGGKV